MTTKVFDIRAIVGGVLAAGLIALSLGAQKVFAGEISEAEYLPLRSISYELGSKKAIGYYTKADEACAVTLMLAENSDPDQANLPSAARLHVELVPGQLASVDSAEGRSLQIICGHDADSLTVIKGDTATFEAATI